MNGNIVYPAILIISGILAASTAIIFLTRVSNNIIRFFELYPESKSVLNISLRIVSWLAGGIVFFIFLRWALKFLNLEFTKNLIENIIISSPKYILAAVLIMLGFYVSRIIKERSKDYRFEYKERVILVLDLIIHMTFAFTAFYTIGVNVSFFLEFYKVVLWITGAIAGLIISMSIGIPLGASIYEKVKKEKKSSKKATFKYGKGRLNAT